MNLEFTIAGEIANKEDRAAFKQEISDEAMDDNKGKRLWELSEKLVGLENS